MSRYTRSRAKVNRALGTQVYENTGAIRALDRRPNPPGMHVRRGKKSNYGLALLEKQKIKHYYGLGEKQLRRLFKKASHIKGNTGTELLKLCERRLDNVIREAGFTTTRSQARQGVAHGHFLLNGRKTDVASVSVVAGDVITAKPRTNIHDLYKGIIANSNNEEAPQWIQADLDQLMITVLRLPEEEDTTAPAEVQLVVELMSR